MFIQTEGTPNPATLKFLPGCQVMKSGSANFESADSAGPSPLAARLFEIEGVTGVYLGADFIAATKADDKEWDTLKPLILGAVMDHFTSGAPVMEGEEAEDPGAESGADSGVVSQIKELLETRVRPAVAQDGGDIIFKDYKDGIVYLVMQGACSGCPRSSMPLKHGIENMLRHYIPEIQEVRQVE